MVDVGGLDWWLIGGAVVERGRGYVGSSGTGDLLELAWVVEQRDFIDEVLDGWLNKVLGGGGFE